MPCKGPSAQGRDLGNPQLAPADVDTSETARRATQTSEDSGGDFPGWDPSSTTYETYDLRGKVLTAPGFIYKSGFTAMIR